MSCQSENLLYQIALTQINGVGDTLARSILLAVGNEREIFNSSRKSLTAIPGIATKLVDEILKPEVLRKAEKEVNFILKNKIDTFFITDPKYPKRLRECADSPIILYFKGCTDFDVPKTISIVGTRQPSNYGINFCNNFLNELSTKTNKEEVLIISGLAYGIDINAHKASLNSTIPTVGVLAHGLDRVYPQSHREYALEMLERGGLLSEFTSGTEPDKFNFVRRNRIIAGLADTTIVVESATKGGSLITADIASSYCRDVFAVPGRVNDPKSIGCNKLIAEHKADLFHSVDFFLQQMGWDNSQKPKNEQKELFLNLNDQEQKTLDILAQNNQPLHIDKIALATSIPTHELSSILLTLEMSGVISNMPGNYYTLN